MMRIDKILATHISKVDVAFFFILSLQGGAAAAFWMSEDILSATILLVPSGFTCRVWIAVTRQKRLNKIIPDVIHLKKPKSSQAVRAVVLCGGGGRGAYQLGVLKAFAEKNISIDVIAGVSVGALNASLLISVGLEKAREIFRHELGRALSLSPRSLLIAYLRMLAIEGSHLIIKSASRFRKGIGFILAAISMILLLPENFSNFFLFWNSIIVCSMVVPLSISYGLWLLSEHWNLSVLSTKNLDSVIRKYIQPEKIKDSKTSLVVTLARETELSPEIDFPKGLPIPLVGYVYQPEYINVSLRSTEIHSLLLASISIPFGILPHLQKDSKIYVDGGVVDNAPILPVLEMGCNEVYVIHTNTKGLVNGNCIVESQALLKHLTRCCMLRELSNVNNTSRSIQSYFEARINHIRPSKTTGSLLASLLWGSERLAKRLDEMGFQDGLNVLNEVYNSNAENAC